MMIRRILVTGLASLAILFSVSCGGQDTEELAELQNAVNSLQQEVESLRADVANLAQRSASQPAEDMSSQVLALSESVNAIAQAAAELEGRVAALNSPDDGEYQQIAELLSDRIDALTAQVDAVADGIRQLGEETFTLQLLHVSDMDSSLGAPADVENFSAILDGFRRQLPNNTLVLSSGNNYIPGPRYYAAADGAMAHVLGVPGEGRGDVAFLNAMGFQASAVGNHELDRGAGAFAAAIGSETEDGSLYPGAMFPYLSSNLIFATHEDLAGLVVADAQEAFLAGGGLAKSAVITVGGERIGVVGATTPALKSITAASGVEVLPANEENIDELAAVIQQEVDALVGQGIDKVILLAHMQRINVEKELATKLVDVDIIVAGGSNTLLADATDRLRIGDEAAGVYPLPFESPRGEPVLLVNTDGDYRYLGRLVVEFDAQGLALQDSINPYVSGAYATDTQGGQAFAGRPIAEVTRIAESLRNVLRSRDGNILGKTGVYLAGDRRDVRTQETNLGNLTADANLWYARQYDPEVAVSLKNGGGIRDSIGLKVQPPGTISPTDVVFLPPPANPDSGKEEGDISQFEVEGAVRFNNGLAIVPVTARQLVEVVEHTIGFEGVGEATEGRFPQVGGMRFSFDPTAPAGERVRSLAIVDENGAVVDRVVEDGALAGDPERLIKVVTLDFLANGGDSYPFPVPTAGRVDLAGEAGQFSAPDTSFPDTNGNGVLDEAVQTDPGLADFARTGSEQDALAEYLAEFYAQTPFDQAETPPIEDRRIQDLSIPDKEDTVFEQEVA